MRNGSEINWSRLMPEAEWNLYVPLFEGAREAGIEAALGGGLAFSVYSGRLRNTKDLDLHILPEHAKAMTAILTAAGWRDYYEVQPYDRSWIYRAHRDDVICDIIWTMPNHRFTVDRSWFWQGKHVEVHGRSIMLLGIEHLIVAKLYVFQRDRCDWPDILNIVHGSWRHIDWQYLIDLVGKDVGLLGGILSVYRWLDAKQASFVPDFVWNRIGLIRHPFNGEATEARAFLLDTRDWFGPTQQQA